VKDFDPAQNQQKMFNVKPAQGPCAKKEKAVNAIIARLDGAGGDPVSDNTRNTVPAKKPQGQRDHSHIVYRARRLRPDRNGTPLD
jgi:hypothetical protein